MNVVRLSKVILGTGVGTALFMIGIAEYAGYRQLAEYDDSRLYLTLQPGGTEYYYDDTKTTTSESRPNLRDGHTDPRVDLRPMPEDY